MSAFDAAAILIVMATILGYLNHLYLRLPHTIGLTVIGALASLIVLAFDNLAPALGIGASMRALLIEVDFSTTLMDGMLSFLLFAGALHVNAAALYKSRWIVALLATFGVVLSTVLIGFGFKLLAALFGFDLPLIWCFVFGALISPTDPVAVLGILKNAKVPETLEAKVTGESLFNDGVGIVVFTILLSAALASTGADAGAGAGHGAAGGGEAFSLVYALELFVVEAGGGIALGLILGWLGYRATKRIDDYNLEVLITLAIVMGGYALAQALHVAGPVVMAVAGLMIGNHATRYAMSDRTREYLTGFWSLLDEVLNSVLFLLIGLEVLAIALTPSLVGLGVIGIVLVLAARASAVAVPFFLLKRLRTFTPGAYPVLVWGGLRGGISIALALSLPDGEIKTVLLTATYVIVLFSVVVQGGTVGLAAKRFVGRAGAEEAQAGAAPPAAGAAPAERPA